MLACWDQGLVPLFQIFWGVPYLPRDTGFHYIDVDYSAQEHLLPSHPQWSSAVRLELIRGHYWYLRSLTCSIRLVIIQPAPMSLQTRLSAASGMDAASSHLALQQASFGMGLHSPQMLLGLVFFAGHILLGRLP